MWAALFEEERSAKIKEILELTTFVLSSEIENYLMMEKLRELGSMDMLTGVMNRNEMNNYVDSLRNLPDGSRKSVGILFNDLNGLKKINDTQGHEGGDRLLKNAAAALRELFEIQSIFRAGGDEFVVILTDVTKEQIEEKARELCEAAGHYPDVSFATGFGFVEDCKDVRRALAQADERMYEEKRKYYAGRSRHFS